MKIIKKSEQVQVLKTGVEKTTKEKKSSISDEVIAYAHGLGITPEEATKKLRTTFGTDDPEIIRRKVLRFFAIIGIVLGSIIGYFIANFLGLVLGAICGGVGLPAVFFVLGKFLNRF